VLNHINIFANFLFLLYAILTRLLSYYENGDNLEVIDMSLGQTQYFYNVELSALEENLSHSMDRIARMREKAVKRNDVKAAHQIHKLQRVIGLVQDRIARLK